jgi:hypothetical protein
MHGIDSEAVTPHLQEGREQSVVIETLYMTGGTESLAPHRWRLLSSPCRRGNWPLAGKGHAMKLTVTRAAITCILAIGGSAAASVAPLASSAAVAASPAKCVAPVGGHCQLAGTGWVFVYSCEVGTCGYGYSFGFQHVAYGPRGATGTWHRAKAKPHDVTITFHLSSGTDSFVATLNPHTGTGSGTETIAGVTATFTAIENLA